MFSCDPWGSVEVPEKLVALCGKRQLPLGQSPVAPETKASVRSKSADREAKADEVRVLREQLTDALAQSKASDAELESVRGELTNEIKLRLDAEAGCARLDDALTTAKADVVAVGEKLTEAAGRIADLEQAQKLQPLQPHVSQKHNKHRR